MYSTLSKKRIYVIDEDDYDSVLELDYKVLHGLFYKDTEKQNEVVLAISFDVLILYSLRQTKIPSEEISNTRISYMDVYFVKKKNFRERVPSILIPKCVYGEKYYSKYHFAALDLIEPNTDFEFYSYEFVDLDFDGNKKIIQCIIIVDKNDITKKELLELSNLLNDSYNYFSVNPVKLNMFYPNSIKENLY